MLKSTYRKERDIYDALQYPIEALEREHLVPTSLAGSRIVADE